MNINLAVVNAKIWTANPQMPFAQALAVSGNKIAAVGSNNDIKNIINSQTKVIDAGGKLLLPGLTDSHVHFLEGGFRLTSVLLRDASTKDEFVKRIAEFAKTLPKGAWITGGDWDHENWGGELPHRNWIDAVTPNNPVWINRLDGHMALANSLALKTVGFSDETSEMEGGTIVRDKDNIPTGIFKDTAMEVILREIPERTEEMKDFALEKAMDYMASLGITSVHSLSLYARAELEPIERAWEQKRLRTRIYTTYPLPSWQELYERIREKGYGDQWLKFGGLKAFIDGSLGSHTAAFFEAYADEPNDYGLIVSDIAELCRWQIEADRHNLQLLVHAIGDKAVNIQLNIVERLINYNGRKDRRLRIEHAQHIIPGDIERFKRLDVIASMQPYQFIDDARWVKKIIGEKRLQQFFPMRSLLNHDVPLIFGSDWFVAPPDPITAIYGAITRRPFDGKHPEGLVPEQKIQLEEALKAYTITPAFASFDEDIKGSIEKGKLADFVMLDNDLFTMKPEEIIDAKVAMTVMDGKVVYTLKN